MNNYYGELYSINLIEYEGRGAVLTVPVQSSGLGDATRHSSQDGLFKRGDLGLAPLPSNSSFLSPPPTFALVGVGVTKPSSLLRSSSAPGIVLGIPTQGYHPRQVCLLNSTL